MPVSGFKRGNMLLYTLCLKLASSWTDWMPFTVSNRLVTVLRVKWIGTYVTYKVKLITTYWSMIFWCRCSPVFCPLWGFRIQHWLADMCLEYSGSNDDWNLKWTSWQSQYKYMVDLACKLTGMSPCQTCGPAFPSQTSGFCANRQGTPWILKIQIQKIQAGSSRSLAIFAEPGCLSEEGWPTCLTGTTSG